MEKNNLYSDEVYEKVNKESKLVLEDYILELKAKGRAEIGRASCRERV